MRQLGALQLQLIPLVFCQSPLALALPNDAGALTTTTASALNTRDGASVIPEPSFKTRQTGCFGLLDGNGSGQALKVETTRAAGGWVHGATRRDHDPQRPVASRQGARRRGATRHLKACLLTAALSALWSPLVRRSDLDRQTLALLRVVAHAVYLLECALSSTRKYFSHRFSPSEWTAYVQQLAHAAPQLVWRIECYHYRRVRRHHPGGGIGRRSTAARQKVVTHVASETFEVGKWNDVTAWSTVDRALPFGGTDTHPGTAAATFLRITLANLIVFAHPATGARYLAQEARFQEREGRRDRYCHLTRHMGLPHFRPKALVVRTGLSDVAFASWGWFWLASVAGLTVPYRVWFARHCRPAALTVTKEIER